MVGTNRGVCPFDRCTSSAKALAAKSAHVVLAVRDTDKGAQVAAAITGNVDVQELDLTSPRR